MRTWKTIPILLAALAPFAASQNVTLVPDIGVAQAEYHDAMEAWLHNDRDLEKDLLTGEKEQMRRRVRKAAALRDEVMVKKQAYLDLIVQRLKETRWRAGNTVRLHWTSQTPATEGEMEFKLASDGSLFVERVQSRDSYIPLGMEVLLRR
jgi:hypothetical protein